MTISSEDTPAAFDNEDVRVSFFGAHSPRLIAILYLVCITGAEAITWFVNDYGGMIAHTAVLISLIVHSSLTSPRTLSKLLLALCLGPLTRIMSLCIPVFALAPLYWYFIISIPLLLATAVVIWNLGYRPADVGLVIRNIPLQIVVVISGFGLGILEYIILKPDPVVADPSWSTLIVASAVITVSTGFLEEIVFRGVLQKSASTVWGSWLGIVYVSIIFAALHLGHYSFWDILFVFGVAVYFGWVVKRTGSLLGVTLCHGVINVCLLLIIPNYFAHLF